MAQRHAHFSGENTLKKVLHHVKKYRLMLVCSILCAAATVALSLYVPILIGKAIDCIIGPGQVDFSAVAEILFSTAIAIGLGALLQWIMNILNTRITYQVVRDVRQEAFQKLQILPLRYIDAHTTGEIVSRVITDADQFADGLLLGFTQLFTGVITILGTLAFMFSIRWQIALVVVVLTPISLFVARFIANRTYSMFKLQSETRAEQTALIDEAIGSMKVVQAFSRQKHILARFDEVSDRLEFCSLRAIFFSSITNPATRFVNGVVYAGVALAGAFACVSSADTAIPFTIGQLSCFLSYANQYTKPFNEISGVIAELQNALACASRLFSLMEEPPQISDAGLPDIREVDGDVALQNVSFSYNGNKPLIQNVNLTVMPGQRIAVVGPTGCGKTTLINLLMRFYDVLDGAVLLEGTDIRRITRHSLRSSYGMVLQESWLKHGSIRENLLFGKEDATETEMIAAAKATHADSFIRRLPNGYDTILEEDGGSLSPGQKQLLCITRVMLSKPPMLILDEATSSIDTRTEVLIQKAFQLLMKDRTSFIVAHRLSTIQNADLILVMKDGNIIEQGNHHELLKQNGFYAKLYASQFAQE